MSDKRTASALPDAADGEDIEVDGVGSELEKSSHKDELESSIGDAAENDISSSGRHSANMPRFNGAVTRILITCIRSSKQWSCSFTSVYEEERSSRWPGKSRGRGRG